MTNVSAAAVTVAATVVLVRARPWSALVNRAPWTWLRELGLCAWCLGFWLGLVAGILYGGLLALATGFCVSFIAGTTHTLIRLVERAGDALDLYISERLK